MVKSVFGKRPAGSRPVVELGIYVFLVFFPSLELCWLNIHILRSFCGNYKPRPAQLQDLVLDQHLSQPGPSRPRGRPSWGQASWRQASWAQGAASAELKIDQNISQSFSEELCLLNRHILRSRSGNCKPRPAQFHRLTHP